MQEIVQSALLSQRLDQSQLRTSYINARDGGEFEQAEAIRMQLFTKCHDMAVYNQYVEYLGEAHVWLGMYSALSYAKAKNIRLHIFSCDADDQNKLLRTHFNQGGHDIINEVFVLFEKTGGGHFSLLQKMDIGELKLITCMQRFFKNEKGLKYKEKLSTTIQISTTER